MFHHGMKESTDDLSNETPSNTEGGLIAKDDPVSEEGPSISQPSSSAGWDSAVASAPAVVKKGKKRKKSKPEERAKQAPRARKGRSAGKNKPEEQERQAPRKGKASPLPSAITRKGRTARRGGKGGGASGENGESLWFLNLSGSGW